MLPLTTGHLSCLGFSCPVRARLLRPVHTPNGAARDPLAPWRTTGVRLSSHVLRSTHSVGLGRAGTRGFLRPSGSQGPLVAISVRKARRALPRHNSHRINTETRT
jgi:hypothetical protein